LFRQISEEIVGKKLSFSSSPSVFVFGLVSKHGVLVQTGHPVAEQVVHVHALGPSLLVADLRLVLEMYNHLGTTG
jgi:hypothetical protein